MDFANRRDAFCGKLGLCSVFKQMGFKFTSGKPFVMHPLSAAFEKELREFAAICRIVKGMRHMRLGVFGARTTAFKSVRYDEGAMEARGCDVETIDMTQVFDRFKTIDENSEDVKFFARKLAETGDLCDTPEYAKKNLAVLGAAFKSFVDEMKLDAIAVRCWSELQYEYKVAPCALLGIFNQMGVPAACETDATNAIAMMALSLASGMPAGCLDINNNYGEAEDKCILFHCGPLAIDLMNRPGHVEEHKMFVKGSGTNCSWGLNVGRIKPGLITYVGGRTDNGECQFYMSTGEITTDEIEPEYFGTPGVMHSEDLQRKLQNICYGGFRHHTTFTFGDWERAIDEALVKYLGYKRIDI